MKFRLALLLSLSFVLAACNFSLAEDVTPPPNYASPTPGPDLGALYAAEPPSPAVGAELYSSNCAPCHGVDGLGNGPMAGNLPVAVPAIGLRDIASQVAPADWYKVISLGNLDRGMPPFISHPAAERWDVVAYSFMLSTTAEELQLGADLYNANCAECHGPKGDGKAEANFTDQQFMSQVTGINMYQAITQGKGTMPSYEQQLSEEDMWALTAYVRSLSFNIAAPATPTPEPTQTALPTETLSPAETSAPETTTTVLPTDTLGQVETPTVDVLGEPPTEVAATPGPAVLQVDGTVADPSGATLDTGLVVTLSIYDTNANQVVNSFQSDVTVDGSFHFGDIPAVADMAYWTSVDYRGVTYYSSAGIYDGSVTGMSLPLNVYDSTADWESLDLNLLHIVLDFSSAGVVKVNELYSLRNLGEKTVIMETDGSSLPFVEVPAGVTDLTLKPSSDSTPFLPAENGIAMSPSQDVQYGVVASFSIPYERGLEFSQNIPLAAKSLTLFVIDGTTIESEQLTDGGTQTFNETVYHLYTASNLPAGPLTFKATAPKGSEATTAPNKNSWAIIGVGAMGLVFIVLGIILFLRDRAKARQEELEESQEPEEGVEEDALGNDPDAITDAIISLDEQLRKGEISREAYDKRRTELKERLKKAL